jgi:hypothetical protein
MIPHLTRVPIKKKLKLALYFENLWIYFFFFVIL